MVVNVLVGQVVNKVVHLVRDPVHKAALPLAAQDRSKGKGRVKVAAKAKAVEREGLEREREEGGISQVLAPR